MKSLLLKVPEKEMWEELSQKVFEMAKNEKYSESYKMKDLLTFKMSRGEDYSIVVMAEDCVPISFNVMASNINKEGKYPQTVRVESELFNEPLEIPKEVKVSVYWGDDGINRYKIMKLNHDDIKSMAEQGVSPEEIVQTFGIKWTEEDSQKILESDKV